MKSKLSFKCMPPEISINNLNYMDISSDFKLTATKDASRALMFDVIDGQFAYQDGMTGFVRSCP